MTWVIVGLVAAVLLSTLQKLIPRGRTLHIQRLREQARQQGFIVERQPGSDMPGELYHCIGYRMPLERCPLADEFSCRRQEQGWRWLVGDASTPGCMETLEALPPEVKGIDRQSLAVLVYWQEPDELLSLNRLTQALEPLRKAPL